jgi:hypothetical protein
VEEVFGAGRALRHQKGCSLDAIPDKFLASSMSLFMNDLAISGDLSMFCAKENRKVLQGQVRTTFREPTEEIARLVTDIEESARVDFVWAIGG